MEDFIMKYIKILALILLSLSGSLLHSGTIDPSISDY